MATRRTPSDRDVREQPRVERTVKSAEPDKVRAAVRKIRTRDAELLKRLAR